MWAWNWCIDGYYCQFWRQMMRLNWLRIEKIFLSWHPNSSSVASQCQPWSLCWSPGSNKRKQLMSFVREANHSFTSNECWQLWKTAGEYLHLCFLVWYSNNLKTSQLDILNY
jgi:hypothetical protein